MLKNQATLVRLTLGQTRRVKLHGSKWTFVYLAQLLENKNAYSTLCNAAIMWLVYLVLLGVFYTVLGFLHLKRQNRGTIQRHVYVNKQHSPLVGDPQSKIVLLQQQMHLHILILGLLLGASSSLGLWTGSFVIVGAPQTCSCRLSSILDSHRRNPVQMPKASS